MIDIKELSEQDLKQKIENIKAEHEKTENALKRYEEELERRKQEVPLGVPCSVETLDSDNKYFVVYSDNGVNLTCPYKYDGGKNDVSFLKAFNFFFSKESAKKHAEMLLAWRKALVSNAKGEPIDIKVLLPLLPKGWVAMNGYEKWVWYDDKPVIHSDEDYWEAHGFFLPFNLKPAEDWRESLMECGL